MPQPVWTTPAGSLGTIPEETFFQIPLLATAGADTVYYRVIAGSLPVGMQVTTTGVVQGIPKSAVVVAGQLQDVDVDITSKFAVRAYTTKLVNGVTVIDRLADRTFELTVVSQAVPEFITPPGLIGTFLDGSEVAIQLEFTDGDPNVILGDAVKTKFVSGELPPGLTINESGLIAGIIRPYSLLVSGLTLPEGFDPGYDNTPRDEYPNDFSIRAANRNYQFAIEVTDGVDSNVSTFEIYVYAKESMTADTTDFTADNTFLTADIVPTRTPIMLTPEGSLGTVRSDNYFSTKFEAFDFDGDEIEFAVTTGAGQGYDETLFDQTGVGFDREALSLPPGLEFDPITGWLWGYIPDLGATEFEYKFALRVFKKDNPGVTSDFYYYSLKVLGDSDTEIVWTTDLFLGEISNGGVSRFNISAYNVGGRPLAYRLVSGTRSRLPQGLSLLESGNIVGKVSFNGWAVDNGATTFDKSTRKSYTYGETTFDSLFSFDVNAFNSSSESLGYRVASITVTNGGSGYTEQPLVSISPPPLTANSIRATAGLCEIEGGVIKSIAIGNPGAGYIDPPTITISGGGGSGATAITATDIVDQVNAVSTIARFSIKVNKVYNVPYENLYIKCMPSYEDRTLINDLLQDQQLIPEEIVYRLDDYNFGVAKNVKYVHAYGLPASTIADYVSAMQINHYWKDIVLGPIRTAQALNADGTVAYEVIYSEIVDNLVNQDGVSVGKQVTLPYGVFTPDSSEVDVVYPNSLINMRTQIVDQIGQEETILPLWMTSRQKDGQVLGYTPSWVIAFLKPGQADRVAYNIATRYGERLNRINFTADRYELDRSQSYLWNPVTGTWAEDPKATTFDLYTEYENFVEVLNTNGVVDTVEFLTGNGTTRNFGFVPSRTAGELIVTVNGVIQPYYSPETAALPFAYRTLYGQGVPFYGVKTWNPAETYPAGTIVRSGNAYYQARYDVAPGILLSNAFYWEPILAPNLVQFNSPPLNLAAIGIWQLKDVWVLDPDSLPNTRRTRFDGGATTFSNLADIITGGDDRDKYLLFPQRNILG